MYSRQLEQLARQRPSELAATTRRTHRSRTGPSPAVTRQRPRKPIRSQTGWALVALGLRIAESGGR
jgi:hypothetical protein